MPTTPSHEAQAAESAAREAGGQAIPAGETADALDTGGADGAPQDPVTGAKPAPAAPVTEPAERQLPPPLSIADAKRNAITERFRAARTAEVAEATDEISDFARDGGVPADFREAAGEVQPEPVVEPEPAAPAAPVAAPAPTPEPTTIRLRVNGKDVDMSIEEVRAQAQKALASEDILGEAKTLRNELARIVDSARPGQNGANQTVPNATQTTEPAPNATDPANQGERTALIEAIQFGDPQEAQQLLDSTIAQAVAKATAPAVQQAINQQALHAEDLRGAKVLKDFKDQHPDLANDARASAVIERTLLDLQLEDFKAVGFDLSQAVQGRPATPVDVAAAHRWLRSQGVAVRSPETMLVNARDSFLQWKGVTPKPAADPTPTPAPATPAGQPRVTVSVTREARREAIQPQPSRTSNPGTQAQQAPQAPSRSDVVNKMKERNALRRGQTLGLGN